MTEEPVCRCSDWEDDTCGGGSCAAEQMRQARACTPEACVAEERCIDSRSCEPSSNPYDERYREFADFAMRSFGAETDALIYERFGDELEDPANWWVYVSERSASIGFSTNLPAISYVEYGTSTEYGRFTPLGDRRHYQHLHRLKGLSPDTSYHYRVILEDERGNILIGEDRVLTSESIPNAIHIPADMPGGPPYVLGSAGSTYVLTEDVVANGRAFEVTAPEVTLDLGANTVVYNEEAMSIDDPNWTYYREHAAFGVAGTGDAAGVRILNGTLVQGAGGDSAHSSASLGFNPIYLRTADEAEIAGVRIEYHGPQMVGMYLHWGGPAHIHNNVFVDKGWEITDRHGTGSRAMASQSEDRHVHNNLVARTRQMGLHGRLVHDNEIHIDSYSTNSFGVGGSDEQEVHHNKIFGTGYHVVAIGWGDQNTYHNNYIHLFGQGPQPRWPEYGTIETLSGFRLTQYSGATSVRSDNLYHDNLIIAKGGGCNGSACTVVRGIQHSSDVYITNNVLRDNTIKVEVNEEVAEAAPIVTHGLRDRCPNESPVHYVNNTLISNASNVRFGDSYASGCNHYFFGNTFVKIGDRSDYRTFVFGVGWDVVDHYVFDGTFEGGASVDSVHFRSGGQELTVGWTLTVRVMQGSSALEGAEVHLYDRSGAQIAQGYTDSNGEFSHPVVEYVHRSGGVESRMPTTVSVSHGGLQTETVVDVDSTTTLVVDV